MLNTNQIRQDFPILSRQINGYPLVYLDNAASSQKPQQVISAITDYYQNHNANINRGVHQLAEESTQIYEDSRKIVANFIGVKSDEIIFVRNTTEAINLIAYGWALHNLQKGDEIITTVMEHHSNIVPWQIIAQKTGAIIRNIDIDNEGQLIINREQESTFSLNRRRESTFSPKTKGKATFLPQPNTGTLKSLLNQKTKIVTLTHVSNTLGTINPIHEITQQVKKFNKDIITIVDGAQSVPHIPISVGARFNKVSFEKGAGTQQPGDFQPLATCHQLQHVDFFAFSGHKMLGPMGIGVLYGKKQILEQMHPFLGGGDMISEVYLDHTKYNKVPEKFEAGTPNVAGAVGLAAACKYIMSIPLIKGTGTQQPGDFEGENPNSRTKDPGGVHPLSALHTHEQLLITHLQTRLTEEFPNIKILGPKDPTKRSGLIAFEFPGVHAHDIAQILNSIGVAVRSGHHCTMPLHNYLKVPASTRVSPYLYNTIEEMDKVIEGLHKVKKVFSI